jgi:hypothetical protein
MNKNNSNDLANFESANKSKRYRNCEGGADIQLINNFETPHPKISKFTSIDIGDHFN